MRAIAFGSFSSIWSNSFSIESRAASIRASSGDSPPGAAPLPCPCASLAPGREMANADTIFRIRNFGFSGHFGTVRPCARVFA